jgi:hypothetical protein
VYGALAMRRTVALVTLVCSACRPREGDPPLADQVRIHSEPWRLETDEEDRDFAGTTYSSDRFEVPVGDAKGWEAAVLDHFQAMVTAVIAKLREQASRERPGDLVGGSTWSLDVWAGHPLEDEAKTLLRATRATVEDLRARIDAHNAATPHPSSPERVVFYAGQHVREGNAPSREGIANDENDDDTPP